MEYFNNTLCISHPELIPGIMSEYNLKVLRHRGRVLQVRRACPDTPALFALDSLPARYLVKVYRRYPDLKARAESGPFTDRVEPDGAALDFYQRYRFSDGRHLSTAKQEEYANNAAILNAFRAVLERPDGRRHPLCARDFWRMASGALPFVSARFPHSLPEHPRRLQEKYEAYLREGYAVFVTGMYGIRNAAKVDDDDKESLLVRLLADARNLDNAQIAALYNTVARGLGWKTLTASAVGIWRRNRDLVTSAGRLGGTRFRNSKAMQVKRSRPTAPLLYWTLDGWVSELLYQKTKEVNGHRVTTYTNRLTVVIVLDPCVDYPVGYAIGERETPSLIKAALRNASNHTAELFGKRYYPTQLQSDHYGRGKLTPLYRTMSRIYTPARVHNAKSKVIEPFFNRFNRKYCQGCINWGGFGITSDRDLQPNSEYLNKHRHDFPTGEECRRQLASFIERERAEKRDEYVGLFEKLPEERRLVLPEEQYLLMFGEDTGFRNALEGAGLRPTLLGEKRTYDCFDPKFREYAHVRWSVKYDPTNLDRVLAVNGDGTLRFMLEKKHVQPMALADRKEGDAGELTRINRFNEELERDISTRLSHACGKVEQLFADHPQLDVATRLLLCDSRGRNKAHKRTSRSAPPEEDEENIFNLY